MAYKQMIVMRTDLNMRKGKMVSQGAHAAMMMFLEDSLDSSEKVLLEWIRDGMTKICVGVDSLEELLEIEHMAQMSGMKAHVITDAGRTEFGGVPTKTCLALGPYKEEELDKITGHLELL